MISVKLLGAPAITPSRDPLQVLASEGSGLSATPGSATLREYAPKLKKAAGDILLNLVVLPHGTIVELPGPTRELPRNRPRLHSHSSYAWTDRTGWVIVDTADLKELNSQCE